MGKKKLELKVIKNGSSSKPTKLSLPNDNFTDLLLAISSRLKISNESDAHLRLFSDKGEEIHGIDKLSSGSIVYFSTGEEFVPPLSASSSSSRPTTPSSSTIQAKPSTPSLSSSSSNISESQVPPVLFSLPIPPHSPPVVPEAPIAGPGPSQTPILPPPISQIPPPLSFERRDSETLTLFENHREKEKEKEKDCEDGDDEEPNKPAIVSPVQAQEIRVKKEKISAAEDHPFVCMSLIDKSGGHLLIVFNIPKGKLEVYKHQIKSQKDILPQAYPSPAETYDFSSITSFTVSQSIPEKGASPSLHMEHHVNVYGGSNLMISFRLMHVCQLDPLSEVFRSIVEGQEVMTYFQMRPNLCLKKGIVGVRLKKEDRKVYLVITVRTLALYLKQTDKVPIFSLPLPVCELVKSDMSLHITAIGQNAVPSLHFLFEPEIIKGDLSKEDKDLDLQRREKERDIWYQAMRKATRIGPEEVGTVIELQNDIIAHYGLPFEKARLPSISLLRKLWSFLEIKEEFNEGNFNSRHWKDLGFQGENPLSDLKRVGILGLRHLSYFGERWPDIVTAKIKLARDKKLAGKGYALALVGVLVTDLLTSLVGLHPNREGQIAKFPSSFPMFFHHSLNPKMFDELFCWGMHVFDLLWEDQAKAAKGVGTVMGLLKERLGKKLRQPPVHGGFEMLFFEENKVVKTRIAKRNDLAQTREVLVSLYPQLAAHLTVPDSYLVMAINKASPHSMSQGLAIKIQKLYRQNNCLMHNLLVLLELEVETTLTGTTLFRENNICTYMLTTFTRELAKKSGYLDQVIVQTVVELIQSGKNFDFSGRNKEPPEVIEENSANVIYFVEKFFNNIINSFDIMPIEFRMIAYILQSSVLKKFPECRHSVVGSFLFLRLLCPLIVTPLTEWEGVPDPVPVNQKKGLVLMSKVLQNISNGTFLREANTDFINKWLTQNQEKLQQFFDRMSEKLPDDVMPPRPPSLKPEQVIMDFDDILHIHSFLHSHLLQVDEAIRTQLPVAITHLNQLVLLLVALPSGIEPFLE
mmetsp:Transcript_14372/g.19948  ORF Transcript_14372/g.19948 Transcript_14372/m.19948 type:complete len:1030 (-) Transcript_14372:186-3275(-)